jgi:subtilisin family serine protease
MRRSLIAVTVVSVLTMSVGISGVAWGAGSAGAPPHATVDQALSRALSASQPGGFVKAVVRMRSQADLSSISARGRAARLRKVVELLHATADAAQAGLAGQLSTWRSQGLVPKVTPLWAIDGVAITAAPVVIQAIAARSDVLSVSADAAIAAPAFTTSSTAPPEPNINLIGAPTLWEMGFTGQGIVVANMDTGVSVTHPDLSGSYRGGTDSWFDPNGQHATPADLSGHGTFTMGVMVGGDAGGTSIGVAPGAKWIAAKIFDDQGSATTSGIHAAFQWLLDPDGNPATPDAPNVVEGSWTMNNPGCDLSFETDLEALRSAGILPVFAAGNSGPATGTSYSPANNPAGFAVGATDNSDVIGSFSSEGPSACTGDQPIFPDVTAPGVNIRTTGLFGAYADESGTSLAAPHAAGALALLLSAFPGTQAATQESALDSSAVDLGDAGPDNIYGNGRIDVAAAYTWLQSQTPPPQPELLSIKASGNHTLGLLTGVQKKDIVSFDGANYAMVFDGSDLGLGGVRLDAVARLSANSLLMSFATPVTLPGLGAVDDSDVVRFDATSLGTTTAGTFSMWLHGADVGLTTDGEDIDALALLPDGRVLISTSGWTVAPGLKGVPGQDILAFTPTSLGSTTAGSFAYYLDGSDVGLSTGPENVDAIDVGADGHIVLSTIGAFSVSGVSGTGDDVFECAPTSLGSDSACTYSPTLVLNGAAMGLAGLGVDDFHR